MPHSILCSIIGRGLALTLTLWACVGCEPGPTTTPPTSKPATETARITASEPLDIWTAMYLQGAKVGHSRLTRETRGQGPQATVRWTMSSKMAIVRKRETIEPELTTQWLENDKGGLIEFDQTIKLAESPRQIHGVLVGDRLKITVTASGHVEKSDISWEAGYGGFMETELSLSRAPLKPGEQRRLRQLDLSVLQVVDVELKAIRIEPTLLLDHSEDLLRIERTVVLPDKKSLQFTLWADRSGEVLKSRSELLALEEIRCPKAQALAPNSSGQFDLMLNNYIKPDRPLTRPQATRRVRYLVQLDTESAAEAFANCQSQQVKPVGQGVAELTVRALRPDSPLLPLATEPGPTEDDSAPNSLIQSDDERVQALAKKGIGDATDAWDKAVNLEKFVHTYITQVNFSQGFASAAEVAAKPEGDCTEHAVLLAALCRANKIPARVAIGLVYSPPEGFFYHMWTDVWIKDRWIPLDAIVGQGGLSAAYLKITATSLKGASAFSSFLPVAQVMGRLKVKVLEVE